jgi:tRNA dimethylallyltransferase
VVAGPTASGKSALALHLAETFSGEIVNCDSLQVYLGFDLGTAKLPRSERNGIPHHLIDVAAPGELFTAGDYARLARQALAEIAGRGRLPVVTGGTGFYLRALLDGLFQGPARDQPLRDRLAALQQRRPGALHRLLRRLDPASASRIHPNDVNKTMRAVEVSLRARTPMSELFRRGRDPLRGYRFLRLALDPPREALYHRIGRRVVEMFHSGLLQEVRSLLDAGVPRHAPPFQSLGYKQALQVLDGAITPEAAIADTQLQTRRYAKRQWTWFRRDPDMIWLAGFGDDPSLQARARRLTSEFLDNMAEPDGAIRTESEANRELSIE